MKETHYKLRHRVTVLIAAAVMLCSMLPGAAFAEETEPQPTEEVVQMEQQTEPSETDNGQADESSPDPGAEEEATPKTAEEQPAEEEISAAVVGAELYADLPDAPIGSYIGSEGLPVATGHTKIGISEWPESQLEEISGSYLTADALDSDGLTMTAPLLDGADYAVVPIMAQVEYPADGSSTDIILPDGVTVLDFYGAPADDADTLLHSSYYETSAAVMGLYVQAADDFSAQLVYTDPNGDMQTKTLNVTIDREHTVASPFADAGIAAYGERPIPDVTNGKITKVAKVNGTWLIWFNGDEAYCCTPGADGQPKNCPTYTYVDTSMVGADQYVPGDHYGNQFRIWGGLTQLSLGMQELPPVALSAEAPSLLDFCRTIYTDAQMQIIENYPDSTAAKILMGSAQALLEGTDAYASARGYYTYVSGFNCIPQNAYEIMMETKIRWRKPVKDGNILAYHIIQSFSPGEATPDQVHQIGCEFAQRFLADRFECTVSTHLDRGHLHNHIVVNSVSYKDGKMFRSDFDAYYKGIRKISDELCRENRLSVIETDGKGKSYAEWISGQTGKPTIRGMVRKDVEQAIVAADSFDGFILELQNMGYTVKYGPRVEHMAVRHKNAQRNVRIDWLDPRFSESALREYYRQLHRMPAEMQQEYRQENAPAKPQWQPTELQPTVRRARYRGKLPRRYSKVSGFMACYYHYCALLRKAYHGKATKRCYFLLREDFLQFNRYQRQTKLLWEHHMQCWLTLNLWSCCVRPRTLTAWWNCTAYPSRSENICC